MMIDQAIIAFDRGLKSVFGPAPTPSRPLPVGNEHPTLTEDDRQKSEGYMRVNHVGEVCASALYLGAGLVARSAHIRAHLWQAQQEEQDHLAWCEARLTELKGRPSYLTPLWFAGAFGMGVISGLAGDKVSLGFVVETEKQVEAHLDGHLEKLPEADTRSRAIVSQMKTDEALHGQQALAEGGTPLPRAVQGFMKLSAKLMTLLAERI